MASTTASDEPERKGSVGALRAMKYGAGALAAACVVNVLILFISLAVTDFPSEFVGGPFGPLAVGPVGINSALAAVGATLVYGVLARYAARPNRTFVVVAGVALLLSFAMFLAPDIAGAPLDVFVVLAVMHVATAIVIVGILTRARSSEVASR